ncbi:MAG TPA: PadR family transcriptional regulator [Ktedonobacteraceae bacterium]|nr:PadR family transcriptional regulator [Ktedonobacteraceae bacterium]
MYSEILILAILQPGPRHGYELKKDIDQALGGMVFLSNKTLYQAIKRFEELGAVTRQVVIQQGKPNRHIYHLTERGVELLHASLRDFPLEQAASDAEFFTRVAFFAVLEVKERPAILCTRLTSLKTGLEYLEGLQQLVETQACAPIVPTLTNAQRILAFQTRRIRDEYAWIASWLEEFYIPR